MSDAKKDNDDERFREFLRGDNGSGDDFDREAREGFRMLGSEEEARALKSEVDRRIAAEIAGNTGRRYWLAAAAVLLVIGFSVYYVNNNAPEPEQLSLGETQQHAQFEPPPPADMNAAAKSEVTLAAEDTARPAVSRTTTKRKSQQRGEGISSEAHATEAARADKGAELQSDEGPAASQKIAAAPAAMPSAPQNANGASPVLTMTQANDEYFAAPALKENRAAKKAAHSQPAAEAAKSPEIVTAVPVITADYPAGHDSLCARVARSVPPEVRRYDVKLFINADGKVSKIVWLATYGMSKIDKRSVENALLQLDGFKLSADPGPVRTVEFDFGCSR